MRAELGRMSHAPLLSALAAALLAASAASAQEVVKTGPDGAPPAAAPVGPMPAGGGRDPEQSPQAIGAWARGVLAGEPSREQAAAAPANGARPSGCTPPPDRKPHGEVWAGAGTGGYRDVGGVVTQPLGDCGSITVMIDQSQSNYRWRGR
jgi:hypothetical protein